MTDPVTSWSTFALAILALVAVGVTYWGIRRQTDSFAQSVSADLCLKMVDRFDAQQMLRLRKLAAQALLSEEDLVNADDVFDFFEMLGLYVRRNMLDKEIVHSLFFHWVNLYWHAGKDYILKYRERSDDIYRDFETLYKTVLAIEMKTAPRSRDINPTAGEIQAFLLQEIDQ